MMWYNENIFENLVYIVDLEFDVVMEMVVDGMLNVDIVFRVIEIRFLGIVVVVVWDNFMYELVEEVLRKNKVVVCNLIFEDDFVVENVNNRNLWFWRRFE